MITCNVFSNFPKIRFPQKQSTRSRTDHFYCTAMSLVKEKIFIGSQEKHYLNGIKVEYREVAPNQIVSVVKSFLYIHGGYFFQALLFFK